MVANRTPLIWSPEAIADLESIWDFYIDAAGQRTAEKRGPRNCRNLRLEGWSWRLQ